MTASDELPPRVLPLRAWSLAWLAFLIAMPGAGIARAGAPLPPALARIAAVLPETVAGDLDRRIRARRLVRGLLQVHYRRLAPAGMAFFAGKVVFMRGRVRMDGGFYLGRREVSTGQFVDFWRGRKRGANGSGAVARWHGRPVDLPVVRVSLVEAREFAAAHGARLPLRAELQAASTCGGRYRYPWGDRFDPSRVNSLEAGLGRPVPVQSRSGGGSALGILHLLGNVAEWTDSVAGKRRGRNALHLVVGGSYRTPARHKSFTTYRLAANAYLPDVGFRLAKSLPALPASIALPAPPRAP